MSTIQRVLVTVPASNYCEKARWALEISNLSFREEGHAPLWAWTSTIPRGGKSVPLLSRSDGETLTDSKLIVSECAKSLPWLYPSDDTLKYEIYLDDKFGVHTRRVAYHTIFSNDHIARNILFEPLKQTSGLFYYESFASPWSYKLLKAIISKGLNVTDEGANRSIERINKIFKEVDEILGDNPIGKKFLSGDHFSASDMAFASHASLLLIPAECIFVSRYFTIDDIADEERKKYLLSLRLTKAGKHALYCYEKYRNKAPEEFSAS